MISAVLIIGTPIRFSANIPILTRVCILKLIEHKRCNIIYSIIHCIIQVTYQGWRYPKSLIYLVTRMYFNTYMHTLTLNMEVDCKFLVSVYAWYGFLTNNAVPKNSIDNVTVTTYRSAY